MKLSEQNQLTAWRDCELAGLKHQLSAPVPVVSVYVGGAPVHREYPSTVRRCRRCPVSIYTRGR